MISPNRCGAACLFFLWAGDLPPFIYRDTRSLLIMSNRPALNTPPLLPRSDGKEGPLLAISPIPWSEGDTRDGCAAPPLPATVSSVCVFYRLLPPLSCTSSSASAHMFTKMRLGRPPKTHPRMGCFGEGEFLLSRRGRRKEGSAGRSLQTRAITQSTNKICRFSGREKSLAAMSPPETPVVFLLPRLLLSPLYLYYRRRRRPCTHAHVTLVCPRRRLSLLPLNSFLAPSASRKVPMCYCGGPFWPQQRC